MKKKILIILLSVAGIFSLWFSHDLSQRNPETIFLTEKSLEQYDLFKKEVVEKHALVIKKETKDKNAFYENLKKIEELCVDDCEMITPRKLKKNQDAKESKNELMHLESADYIAVIIQDNNDEIHKKILTYAEASPYWSDAQTSFAGIPYTNYLLDKYSLVIQEKLFPAMFIMGLVISVFFIGRVKNAVVVYLPCLFAAGFSLTTLKLLYGQMNMVTSIIPLVVFTVTLSLSFHLYFSLMELKSLKNVFKVKWVPIFLMMFTTYIGFLSLGWAEIYVIRQFGFVSSQLVLFATLFAFLWYFLWEEYLAAPAERKITFFSSKIFARTLPAWMIIVFSILGIASVVMVPKRLNVITDATLYFPKDKKIRERILSVTETVSGMPIMEIALSLGHDFDLASAQKIKTWEEGIGALKLSQNYKIISNNTLVTKVNHEYSGNEQLPESIESYLLLRGQLPPSLQESYPVEGTYRLTLLGTPLNVTDYMQDLKKVEDYLKDQKLSYLINGIHHNLMVSQGAMIDVLAKSFLSSAIVIFIFSALFLKSLRFNLVFITVSLLPVALTFGLMYLLGFSINIATVMTFSISLGLVGDSSFHIIYAKKVRFKDFDEYGRGVLSPVVGSGLLLCTCFGMFAFNSFMPIREFGGILAIIMLLGTLADLYVLPTLLYGTSDHKKAYEEV